MKTSIIKHPPDLKVQFDYDDIQQALIRQVSELFPDYELRKPCGIYYAEGSALPYTFILVKK